MYIVAFVHIKNGKDSRGDILNIYNATEYNNSLFKKIFYKFLDEFKLTEDAANAEIIICDNNPLNLYDFGSAKFAICNMTNTDHIELPDNIKMINLKGEAEFLDGVTSTAHHTIYLMLCLVRRCSRHEPPSVSLENKTIGIIGYGRVGKQVAELCKAFGMIVSHYDKGDYIDKTLDFYSVHISIEPGQEPVIDRGFLECIENGAYIINTSRPQAVDPIAIRDHMYRLGGFASDFYYHKHFHFWRNRMMTNHTGGWCMEALKATADFCFDKLMEELKCIS